MDQNAPTDVFMTQVETDHEAFKDTKFQELVEAIGKIIIRGAAYFIVLTDHPTFKPEFYELLDLMDGNGFDIDYKYIDNLGNPQIKVSIIYKPLKLEYEIKTEEHEYNWEN